jgi:hypothetical protein
VPTPNYNALLSADPDVAERADGESAWLVRHAGVVVDDDAIARVSAGRIVDRRDRVAGGLLGVHAGDALGATVEFSSWASIRDRYPDGLRDIVGGGPFGWSPGDATDDTDLTRAVLLAYLAPGDDVVRAAADNMVAWLRGDWPGRRPGTEPRDIGGATAPASCGICRPVTPAPAVPAWDGPATGR